MEQTIIVVLDHSGNEIMEWCLRKHQNFFKTGCIMKSVIFLHCSSIIIHNDLNITQVRMVIIVIEIIIFGSINSL